VSGYVTLQDLEGTLRSGGIIACMRNLNLLVRGCIVLGFLVCTFAASGARGQVLRFADLNTRDFAGLDRDKTVVVVPGGILEEHGPYLPASSDGIFNSRLAEDLAAEIVKRPGWKALVLPMIPLGAGSASEIGKRFAFPGDCTVLPTTLRAIFMDLGDQLGKQGFRWVIIVHGHGDAKHNLMLDEAGDYFHDSYGGEMVNLFGYLWAMDLKDFRTAQERLQDGQPEHATMNETSWILALRPELVSPDYKTAKPMAGKSIQELAEIASQKDWPGYFGAPALATKQVGEQSYAQWFERSKDFVQKVLAGENYRNLPRYSALSGDEPGHAEAAILNEHTKMLRQHHAPEMAKVKPLLDPSWTPFGPQLVELVERRVAR
jgi:creatinine amidohydrolase/Fe(II)-dependent formamide hydrolase-like protein